MCINQHDLFLFSQPSFEKKNDTGEGVLILQNLYPILLYKPSKQWNMFKPKNEFREISLVFNEICREIKIKWHTLAIESMIFYINFAICVFQKHIFLKRLYLYYNKIILKGLDIHVVLRVLPKCLLKTKRTSKFIVSLNNVTEN